MKNSMLTKAWVKRAIRREHSSNYRAGEVDANKHYLERTGIRGRKRWLLIMAVIILAIIILGNFILTCVVFGVLRITADGTESFHFDDDGDLVFTKSATLDSVQLAKGLLASSGQHTFRADRASSVILQSGTQRSSLTPGIAYDPTRLVVGRGGVLVTPFTSLSVQDLQRELLQVNKRKAKFEIPTRLRNLRATKLATHRISSQSNMQLSANNTKLRGIGGVSLEGRTVGFSSLTGITLESNGAIIISGSSMSFPRLQLPSVNNTLPLKLCACSIASNGTTSYRLFLSPLSCAAANTSHPCILP